MLFNERAQLLRDCLIHVAGRVLIDQRGPGAVLTHPRHEVLGADVGLRGERVSRVLEIVEVQARAADRSDRVRPPGEQVRVPAADRVTPLNR